MDNKEYENINYRVSQLEFKVGINKDGIKTGNGIEKHITQAEEDIEYITNKINEITQNIITLSQKINQIETQLNDLQNTINVIKKENQSNLTFSTISKLKNVLIALAASITAFYVIGRFIYNILHNMINTGVIK